MPRCGSFWPYARILRHVGEADDSLAAKGRPEQRRRARHRKPLEVPAIDARQRVEHVRAAAGVEHVVEERPELRAHQTRRRIGERLHQLLQIELGRQHAPEVVDDLQRISLLAQQLLRAHLLGDVLHDAEHPDDRAVFGVGRVSVRRHPPFARVRPDAVLDVVVRAVGEWRSPRDRARARDRRDGAARASRSRS